jgi:hypothetical protein
MFRGGLPSDLDANPFSTVCDQLFTREAAACVAMLCHSVSMWWFGQMIMLQMPAKHLRASVAQSYSTSDLFRLLILFWRPPFVWLVADGWCWFVLRGKYCWLVADGWFVLREKYCWLVADKPSEQVPYLEKESGNNR